MQVEAQAPRALIAVAFGRTSRRRSRAGRRAAPCAASRSARRRRRRQRRRPLPPALGELVGELLVHVAPLGQPQVVHELRAAGVDPLAMRQPLPERARRRTPTASPARGSRSARRGTAGAPGRPPAARSSGRSRGSGTASARGDDQRLGEAPGVARGEHDPPDARVERQARELAPGRRQRACRRRPRPAPAAAGSRRRSRAGAGGSRNGKVVDGAELERGSSAGSPRRASCAGSPDRCTRAAPRSRPRRTGARRCRPATRPQRPARWFAAACAIFSMREQRGLVAHAVALDAGEPGVDHVADAGHRERGLGDVRREHDAPAARRREHALLVLHRQPRVQRQQLDVAGVGAARQAACAAARPVSRISRSPGRNTRMSPGPSRQSSSAARRSRPRAPPRRRPPRRRSSARAQRPVAHLDRVGAAGDLDHRRRPAGACRSAAAKRSASSVAEVTTTLEVGRAARAAA